MSDEDKRTAVGMSVTLSGQLMSAALAIIALGGGLIAVFVQNRDVGGFFYIAVTVSFLAFVFSIYIGGRGITISRTEGFQGKWDLQSGAPHFNKQAIACFVGLISFLLAVIFSGSPKDSETSKQIAALQKTSGAFEQKLLMLSKANEDLRDDLRVLSAKVDNLVVGKLRQTPTKPEAGKPAKK
jgi:hypothetical protein